MTAGAAASRRLEARIAELEAELGMADRASDRRGDLQAAPRAAAGGAVTRAVGTRRFLSPGKGNGAAGQDRTVDLSLTKDALYH